MTVINLTDAEWEARNQLQDELEQLVRRFIRERGPAIARKPEEMLLRDTVLRDAINETKQMASIFAFRLVHLRTHPED